MRQRSLSLGDPRATGFANRRLDPQPPTGIAEVSQIVLPVVPPRHEERGKVLLFVDKREDPGTNAAGDAEEHGLGIRLPGMRCTEPCMSHHDAKSRGGGNGPGKMAGHLGVGFGRGSPAPAATPVGVPRHSVRPWSTCGLGSVASGACARSSLLAFPDRESRPHAPRLPGTERPIDRPDETNASQSGLSDARGQESPLPLHGPASVGAGQGDPAGAPPWPFGIAPDRLRDKPHLVRLATPRLKMV